jgi:hypothetical protein
MAASNLRDRRGAERKSYRRYGLGNSITRGFGYAAGFALFSLVAGIVSGATVGLWSWTGQINPMMRLIVRGLLIAGLVVGLLILLANL